PRPAVPAAAAPGPGSGWPSRERHTATAPSPSWTSATRLDYKSRCAGIETPQQVSSVRAAARHPFFSRVAKIAGEPTPAGEAVRRLERVCVLLLRLLLDPGRLVRPVKPF